MLQALLRGKLSRQQENLEDLLTSAVFGPLQYIAPERGLLPLLRLARFDNASKSAIFGQSGITIERMIFWPVYLTELTGSTEPDVMIFALDDGGQRHVILIEVKLWSAKSSSPDPKQTAVVDQLAREWCVLLEQCQKEHALPHMIYVTADRQYPSGEINESVTEFSSKCEELSKQFPMRCSWLPWIEVPDAFEHSEEPFLRDVAALCERLDLVRFQGMATVAPHRIGWSFEESGQTFKFNVKSIPIQWEYQ